MKKIDMERLFYLRSLGYSYTAIGRVLHISRNTLKAFCRNRGVTYDVVPKTRAENAKLSNCKYCDKPLVPRANGPVRQFCGRDCHEKYYRHFSDFVVYKNDDWYIQERMM